MKLSLLVVCCALIYFVAINTAVSLLVAALWRARAQSWRRRTGGWLFFLRVFPVTFSFAFVALAFLPSFLAHEPREAVESVNLWLAVAAGLGLAILALGITRALAAWRATRIVVRNWRRASRAIELPGWRGSAFSVEGRPSVPAVFVAGYRHPQLFLARCIEAVCTAPELAAIVAHETAHTVARDNLKKLAMRCLPDVLGLMPAAAEIERAWSQAVEDEADVEAIRSRGTDGLELASAIVKVSRIHGARESSRLARGTSPLHAGGPIACRVRRLSGERPSAPRLAGYRSWAPWLALLALPGVLLLVPGLSIRLHRVTEAVVQLLRGF